MPGYSLFCPFPFIRPLYQKPTVKLAASMMISRMESVYPLETEAAINATVKASPIYRL